LRTARNLAIDHRRREACRTRVFLYESEMRGGGLLSKEDAEPGPNYEGFASGADPDESPEERCLRKEERGIVVELLDSLSEYDRRLLFLREVMGVPWSEIARELGVGQENLRVRYSRLKARLRGALEATVRL
jgi:RNA polymerase sigma factor (sigma-70 family)